MPRPAVQLGVLDGQFPRENAAIVQGCVPLVLIDGRAYADELAATLREELSQLPVGAGIATILVGDDLAAQVYQRRIDRHAREAGIASRPVALPADATLGQVVGKIAELVPRFIPSTPAAAFHMLDRYTASVGRHPAIAYAGLDLVLVGRSNNVGKPAAILGLQRNATVISAHRHTFDAGRLAEHTRAADILIVAVGVPGLITGDLVREGALVIDIGINAIKAQDGSVTLVGDVDTPSVERVAEAVSPVPGGVGPITDIWVLRNTVTAAWLQTSPPEHHAVTSAGS